MQISPGCTVKGTEIILEMVILHFNTLSGTEQEISNVQRHSEQLRHLFMKFPPTGFVLS